MAAAPLISMQSSVTARFDPTEMTSRRLSGQGSILNQHSTAADEQRCWMLDLHMSLTSWPVRRSSLDNVAAL